MSHVFVARNRVLMGRSIFFVLDLINSNVTCHSHYLFECPMSVYRNFHVFCYYDLVLCCCHVDAHVELDILGVYAPLAKKKDNRYIDRF